eukprot:10685970-Lingulodinium_polyedra.AAC.1
MLHAQLAQLFEPTRGGLGRPANKLGQFSVRTPMGAEILARIVRGWLAEEPELTLAQLDLKNAYGSAYRGFMLGAVVRGLPGMAPMLAAEWAPGTTRAWVRGASGWQALEVERGTWQGSPFSNVAFCCALRRALEATELAKRAGVKSGQYADDCFFHADDE